MFGVALLATMGVLLCAYNCIRIGCEPMNLSQLVRMILAHSTFMVLGVNLSFMIAPTLALALRGENRNCSLDE